MKLRKKRDDVFLHFMSSYIAILIIPLLIGFFTYEKAFDVVEAEEKDNALSSMEMAKNIADSYISGVERVVIQLSSDKNLNEILDKKSISNYSMKILLDGLKSYFSVNDKHTRYYIFLKNSNYVLTPETVFQKDFFFNSIFKYGDNNSELIRKMLLNSYIKGEYWPETSVMHEEGTQKAIAYVQSIPLNYNNQADGVILSLIDSNLFMELLSNIDTSEGSWGYIADKNNNILTSVSADTQEVKAINVSGRQGFFEFTQSNDKMLAAYSTSSISGWKYVAVIPSKVILKKVNGIKAMTMIIMFVTLLLGIVFAFMLSIKNVRPIKSMAEMFSESGNGDNRNINYFDFIKGNITNLLHSNNHLQKVLNDQISLVKTAFFDRLLKGEFVNDDLDAIANYLGLDLKDKKFIVALISLYNNNELLNEDIINEMTINKILVKDTIVKNLSENVLINEFNGCKLVLLISADNDSITDSIQKSFGYIYNQIESSSGLKLHIALSECFTDLKYTNQSFEEAMRALEYILNSDNDHMIWYHDISKHSQGFYYPFDQENRLINIVKSGNYSEAEALLENNYTENIINRRLSPNMANSLILALWITAVKMNIQLQLDCVPVDGQHYLATIKSADEGYSYILKTYKNMCNIITEQKQAKNMTLKNNMLEYINSEFKDPSFSLSSIASKFGLTEAYVSYFFKEQTSENFINYLTDKRIKLACELLSSSCKSVYEIATEVGYNSDQVFRRAFKRKTDMGPAEYRSNHKT